MSTDMHNSAHGTGHPPVHKDVSFEPRDLNPGIILRYLLYLAIVTGISLLICIYVYRFTTKLAVDQERSVVPVRQVHAVHYPPEPMLQGVPGHLTDPQQDLRNKMKADAEANEQLQWIDQKNGIAQIPVADAMKVIVEKGLPAVPAPPAEKQK